MKFNLNLKKQFQTFQNQIIFHIEESVNLLISFHCILLLGKTKTLYSQRKIFCLNKLGHLFPAWKFVK